VDIGTRLFQGGWSRLYWKLTGCQHRNSQGYAAMK
jgi:hypothetical protein